MRINLLPPDIKEGQKVRRQTALVATLGVVVVALLGGFFFLQQVRLKSAESELAREEAENARIQSEIDELSRFGELAAELAATQGLLDQLLANQVLWSGVLRDISLVIPGQVWLTTLSGTVSAETTDAAGAAAAVTQDGAGIVGEISFTGRGIGNHRQTALWLARLEDVDGFVNPWLSTSTTLAEFEDTVGTPVVEFTSSVDLSQAIVTPPGGQT